MNDRAAIEIGLQKVRATLEEASIHIDKAIELISLLLGEEVEKVPPDWLIKRLRLLWAIEKRGGVVTREELHRLARDIGYDPRGLGGLFKGGYLVTIAGDRVAITEKARELIDHWRDWLERNFPDC